MSEDKKASMKAAGEDRVLNVRKDPPDIRDRMYEPALIQLKPELDKREAVPKILDQGREGSCTGFGLAAVINLLNAERQNTAFFVSPRMLYAMAQKHDEWPGEDYAGSSCRGAIRGWKNMGVCSETDWPYDANTPGELTIKRARAARANTLGAYYRLRAEINDYHAALNEVGAIYASAKVHSGWSRPKTHRGEDLAEITPSIKMTGGHAFAIVGYTSRGFIVQNSWGPDWGSGGFALWRYEDWLANIKDGWVFRLAIATPQIFGITARSMTDEQFEIGRAIPKRLEIAGHFVHFDDGEFKHHGSYWSTLADIRQTAEQLKSSVAEGKYRRLLIYAHGGLNSPKDSARRIAALKDGFMRNGIYPFHVMYDTGLVEEIKDTVIRAFDGTQPEGFFREIQERLADFGDELIEDAARKPGTAIWEEMKRDARLPFRDKTNGVMGDGAEVIRTFADTLKDAGIQLDLVGHSTGAILLGHLLEALDALGMADLIHSCSLMAPACSVDFFNTHYQPRLAKKPRKPIVARLPVLDVYGLNEQLENDDNVVYVYRKSLLYLVSRAFERQVDKPLLGMQRDAEAIEKPAGMTIHYSDGIKGNITRSTSHGGFDNDHLTMNSIMKRILDKKPLKPFKAHEMEGY